VRSLRRRPHGRRPPGRRPRHVRGHIGVPSAHRRIGRAYQHVTGRRRPTDSLVRTVYLFGLHVRRAGRSSIYEYYNIMFYRF